MLCIPRLENLEKANADLQAFRELAQCSLEAQTNPMKRTRVTSGEVGECHLTQPGLDQAPNCHGRS